MKIKRSDKQYTDIETFEEYEFTECIAYEMAIRHPRIIEIYRYQFCNDKKPDNYLTGEELYLFGMPDVFYLDYHFFNDADDKYFHSNNKTFDTSVKEDEVCIYTFKEHNGFLRRTVVEKNDMEMGGTPFYQTHEIIPWFKRPKIWIEKFDGTANLSLNLNLPLNDLIDFIKLVKQHYDRNILKNPYDEFVYSIPKHKGVSLGKSYKMADIFYVYDAIKLNYLRKDIQDEVYNYYADKGIETRTLDYKTIKKYYEFAKDYIENKRYLEIVTGRNIEDIQSSYSQ